MWVKCFWGKKWVMLIVHNQKRPVHSLGKVKCSESHHFHPCPHNSDFKRQESQESVRLNTLFLARQETKTSQAFIWDHSSHVSQYHKPSSRVSVAFLVSPSSRDVRIPHMVLSSSKSAFYQMHLVYQLSPSLDSTNLVRVSHAFTTLWLAYFNTLPFGLPLETTQKLQLVEMWQLNCC